MFEKEMEEAKAIEKLAIGLLARREHSAKELVRKLTAKGYERDAVAAVIEEIREQGWQSDERYTESWIRHRASAGFGPYRIRQELREKGIEAKNIEKGLQESQIDWYESARDAYNRRFRNCLALDGKEISKRRRFLQGRGFDAEQIKYAMATSDPYS